MNGRPLPIVTQNEVTNLFELNEENLASVLLRADVEDLPVCVLAVAGAFRKGKTFLLDFLLRYCTNRGNANWLGDESSPLEGFRWRQGYRRETTGILIWSEPFLVQRENGDKVAVILMDTQGTFDTDSTFKDSVVVFALSLLASSVLVYNLMNNIQEDDLMNLQTFIAYGTQALNDGNHSTAYQKLLFLVRDWGSSAQLPYGSAGGQLLLEETLKVMPSQSPSQQELRTDVRRCFEDISCYLMPHPGFEALESVNFSGRMCELKENFTNHLKELVPLLLAPENLVVKKLGGYAITAKDLFNNFNSFVLLFNNTDLPEPTTVVESMAQANSQTSSGAGFELYARNMQDFLTGNHAVEVDQLEAVHEETKTRAVDLYRERNNLGRWNGRIFLQFQEQLENDINTLYCTDHKPLVSSKCALKAAMEQYKAAMGVVPGTTGPPLQMTELRAMHMTEKQRALQCYGHRNEFGRNNDALREKYLERLMKDIEKVFDEDLIPRSSSQAALRACKELYTERMDNIFSADAPVMDQLTTKHNREKEKILADYQERNELGRKNLAVFTEFLELLEKEVENMFADHYLLQARDRVEAANSGRKLYVEEMEWVAITKRRLVTVGELYVAHEEAKKKAIQHYSDKKELSGYNPLIFKAYLKFMEQKLERIFQTIKELNDAVSEMEQCVLRKKNAMFFVYLFCPWLLLFGDSTSESDFPEQQNRLSEAKKKYIDESETTVKFTNPMEWYYKARKEEKKAKETSDLVISSVFK